MHPRLPAILSFLLPGLGQLSRRRYGPAVVCFAVFCAVLAFDAVRWTLPAVLAAAAWEASRIPADLPKSSAARTGAFVVTGLLGMLGWAWVSFSHWNPVARQGYLNAASEAAAAEVRRCAARLGALPEGIEHCSLPPGAWRKDPWGAELLYRKTAEGFEIRSRGRDGVGDTPDDFTYRFGER